MTSQKSLKNNVNFNDFKRSLIDSILFPAVALAVLLFFAVVQIIDLFYGPTSDTVTKSDYIYVFFTQTSIFYSAFMVLQIGMVLCGMLTAAKSFYFLLSKKQVNVYLSLGVTRTRMFLNRLGAGAISLFTSLFVPFTIIYLINMAELGVTSQLRNVYLYIVFSLFVASMVGFAISSFAMMVSGNIFESVVTMGAMSFLPTIIANVFYITRDVMLRGYIYHQFNDDNIIFFNPFTFIENSEQIPRTRNYDTGAMGINYFISSLNKATDFVNATLKDYAIDWDLIRPVVIWFVIAVALTGFALFLFNKRKAENSNSLGKFVVSRIIIGAFGVGVACLFSVGALWYEIGTIGVTLLAIGLSFVAYFIIQLILTRKLKTSLKSLSSCVVMMVAFIGLISFIESGYFGQYNKLPEKDNIKAVSISVFENYAYNPAFPEADKVISTNAEDISMVMSLFDEVKEDDGDYVLSIQDVYFEFETKEGEIIPRCFPIYSPDLYNKYNETVINSNFFDGVLEYEFLGFDENNKSKNGEYEFADSKKHSSDKLEKDIVSVDYYDSQLVVPYTPTEKASQTDTGYVEYEGDVGYYEYETEDNRQFHIVKGDDLAVALYNDLSKMTYNDLCKNNKAPIGVLGYENHYVCKGSDVVKPGTLDEDYQYSEHIDVAGIKTVHSWLNIYPEMTETVAFFKNNNIEFAKTYNVPIRQVLYTDSKLTFTDAYKDFANQVVETQGKSELRTYYEKRLPQVSFYNSTALSDSVFNTMSWYISEEITKENLLKKIYTDIGHPLKEVDKDNIDNVLSSSVGSYNFHNDDGRMIFIIYEDGSMIAKYLPEANLGVLK